jgi:hypothetical protein
MQETVKQAAEFKQVEAQRRSFDSDLYTKALLDIIQAHTNQELNKYPHEKTKIGVQSAAVLKMTQQLAEDYDQKHPDRSVPHWAEKKNEYVTQVLQKWLKSRSEGSAPAEYNYTTRLDRALNEARNYEADKEPETQFDHGKLREVL